MTLQEFKAWFDGFRENMDGPPTKKQWARICKRVGEIDGATTTWPIFVDRYIDPWPRRYREIFWQTSTAGNTLQSCSNNVADSAAWNSNRMQEALSANEAFVNLGKADYQQVA